MTHKLLAATALSLVVVLAVVTAHALEGKGGYTATEYFTASDVGDALSEWSGLDSINLGEKFSHGKLAVDSAGTLYAVVGGADNTAGVSYSGMVSYDGTDFTHLLKVAYTWTSDSGETVKGLTVSPVTSGELTADDPVIWRWTRASATAQTYFEIVSVDPTTGPPTETLVHSWDSLPNPRAVVTIDDDGNLYVLGDGLLDGDGNSLDQTIRKLAWNAATSEYDESSVTSTAVRHGLTLGPDGLLYTFENKGFGSAGESVDVLTIDPADGSSSIHATVAANNIFGRWAWDTTGQLWIGLRKTTGKKIHYITEVVEGKTTSTKGRIAEYPSGRWLSGMATGLDGDLYVHEVDWAGATNDTVFVLAPGEGGGGNGNGKGGGKK